MRLVSGYIFEYGNSCLPILPLYLGLTLSIFIADVFHTVVKASSIIFNLHPQVFADIKIFELERLEADLFSGRNKIYCICYHHSHTEELQGALQY